MSQYPPQYPQQPSPYQSPQGMQYGGYPQYGTPYGGDPYAQILAPARRTGVLMIVFGAIGLLLGGCLTGIVKTPLFEQAMSQPGMVLPAGRTLDDMRFEMTFTGVGLLVVGLLYITLGIFVRRGSKAVIITSLVISFLVAGYLALSLLLAFTIGGLAQQGGNAALGGCFVLVPIGLLVWIIIWLFQSIGATNQLKVWQTQYWQYQHMQQAYGQGYGGQPYPPGQQPPYGGYGGPAGQQWPGQPAPQTPQQQSWQPPSPPSASGGGGTNQQQWSPPPSNPQA